MERAPFKGALIKQPAAGSFEPPLARGLSVDELARVDAPVPPGLPSEALDLPAVKLPFDDDVGIVDRPENEAALSVAAPSHVRALVRKVGRGKMQAPLAVAKGVGEAPLVRSRHSL